jgi:NADH dehydrogenase FAD-containing subunit
MGCGSSAIANRKVIVVGGGYAGTAAAKELDSLCDVTLITENDDMEHKWAYMRACVVPGWEKVTRVPLDKLLKKGKVLRGKVISVTDGSVTLESGEVLSADNVILAQGYGSGNLPGGTPSDTADSASFKKRLQEKQAAISAADTILIIGGGPVGVELAGEIQAHFPNKTVKLVHSNAKLLSNSQPPMIDAAVTKLAATMAEMGIEVVLNARVSNLPKPENGDGFIHGSRTYELSNGTSVSADLAVVCIGGMKNDSNLVPANCVDEHNRIKVNASLQVEGLPTAFAIGDCNNVPETKLGYYGGLQAAVAVKNIQKLLQGKKMDDYKPAGGDTQHGVMFIPLGPSRGVVGMGKTVMGDFMTSKIKGKGLFKKKVFAGVNAAVPSVP